MKVAVDEARSNGPTRQPDHPGLLADERFEISESSMSDNQIADDGDRIAVRVTENVTTV